MSDELKSGSDHLIIAENIKTLVRGGERPKTAIARALAHARKIDEGDVIEAPETLEKTPDGDPVPVEGPGLSDEALQAVLERKKRRIFK